MESKDLYFDKIPQELRLYGWAFVMGATNLGLYMSLTFLEATQYRNTTLNETRPINVSKKDLQEFVGMNTTTLKKRLEELKDYGLIKYDESKGRQECVFYIVRPIPVCTANVDNANKLIEKIITKQYRENLAEQIQVARGIKEEREDINVPKTTLKSIDTNQLTLLDEIPVENKKTVKKENKPSNSPKRTMINELVTMLQNIEGFKFHSITALSKCVGKVLRDKEYNNFEELKRNIKMIKMEGGLTNQVKANKLMAVIIEISTVPQKYAPNSYKLLNSYDKYDDGTSLKEEQKQAGEMVKNIPNNKIVDLEKILVEGSSKKVFNEGVGLDDIII